MNDKRYEAGILTVRQASALSNVPEKALRRWIRRGAIQSVPNIRQGWPTVTLAGLIESHLAGELMGRGYSPRKVSDILASLEGRERSDYIENVPKLVTDKVEIFIQDPELLTRLKDGQGAFQWLGETLDPIVSIDGQVRAFDPPKAPFTRVHPGVNGGRLSLINTQVPVFALVGSLQAGESVTAVADEYEVPVDDVAPIAEDLNWFAKAA